MASIPRRAWLLALAALLALLSGPAFALGLGKIEIRSQRGEPLLAEIRIISSDPAELQGLQARLASPDTFARVGLEPPQGIVTDLQFAIALDPQGNPVVRVTSSQPVDQPLLTFLVEVDWGQGRLVREYSVLVDAPRSVSAPAQPPIEAPAAAPSNAIVREPAPAPAAPPAATPAPQPEAAPETDLESVSQSEPESATEAATPVAAAPSEPEPQSDAIPAPPAQPAPRPAAQPVATPTGEYTVQAGDTLGEIARTFASDGRTHAQTMLALLNANPEAFIKGNVNLVRQGAVLRAPSQSQLSQYSASEARAVVREQIAQWREMRAPAPQPVAVAGEGDGASAATAADGGTTGADATDARLEIVPPTTNGGRQAGTRSGIDAGGEGDMLRQQELQQTKETLAARDAEVQELKARVADLEKLQQDQQKLIALKDSRLAEAQQALAARQAEATTAAAGATPPASPAGEPMLWPWAIAALAVVLLLAWLFMRRRPAKQPARPAFDTTALAAGIPKQVDTGKRESAAPAQAPATEKVDTSAAPTWHSGAHPATPADADAVAVAPLNPSPAGHERLELARAYLDLGDIDTARTLLQEVADGGDAAARGEAARLLRELV